MQTSTESFLFIVIGNSSQQDSTFYFVMMRNEWILRMWGWGRGIMVSLLSRMRLLRFCICLENNERKSFSQLFFTTQMMWGVTKSNCLSLAIKSDPSALLCVFFILHPSYMRLYSNYKIKTPFLFFCCSRIHENVVSLSRGILGFNLVTQFFI